jgi:type IV secretion system protein VirB10
MKSTVAVLALLALLAVPEIALSKVAPSPSATDARVRYLTYEPDQVYQLMVSQGRVMTIVLDPAENITALQAGDSASWQIDLLESGNVIVIKLLDEAGETNLTAISDSGRIYSFDIVPNAESEASLDDLAYLVRFNYPDAALQEQRRLDAAAVAQAEQYRRDQIQRELEAQRRADEEAEQLRLERLGREEEARAARLAQSERDAALRRLELEHQKELDRIAAEEATQLAVMREQQNIEYNRLQQELRREEAARVAAEAELRRAEAARLVELELQNRLAREQEERASAMRIAELELQRRLAHEERERAEADRLAEMARLRAEERINSPTTLFDDGRANAAARTADASSSVRERRRRLSDNELFLSSSYVEEFPTSTGQILPRQDRLVAQGTIIQAILETAINSDLPGMIRGQVSEDVYAFDGSSVLIPKGSRLIGRYSSDIEVGQNRIVAAWTRLIRPDGNSIALGSPASDDLGVSGLTGTVDTHFAERFGSAALISVLAGISGYGASQIDDATGQETAANVGNDFTGATSSSFERYLSLAPTIRADQGSRVSVFVARDLFL